MRDNTTEALLEALAQQGITTALCVRLDFASETLGVWTGVHAFAPTGSGDSLLEGTTFYPLQNGVVANIGDNSFSYTGSDALEIAMAIPSDVPIAIADAQIVADEYRGRSATVWRALMIDNPLDPLAQKTWLIRRLRAGTMDKVEVQSDGQSKIFKLTIESHSAYISGATQQTYLDQKRYDPTDTSQDYTAACANGSPAPTKPTNLFGREIKWDALR